MSLKYFSFMLRISPPLYIYVAYLTPHRTQLYPRVYLTCREKEGGGGDTCSVTGRNNPVLPLAFSFSPSSLTNFNFPSWSRIDFTAGFDSASLFVLTLCIAPPIITLGRDKRKEIFSFVM